MLGKKRIFLGLSVNGWLSNIKTIQHELDNVFKKKLKKTSRDSGYISWQKPESLHLTLVFIGEVDHSTMQRISDIIYNHIKQNFYHCFMLEAKKLFLLNHRHLVLNVSSPELFELQKKLQDLLFQEKIIHPERYFNAHITIGKTEKIKTSEQNNILLKTIQKTNITKWQKLKISNIYLFESCPQKKYVPVSHFHLIENFSI